MAAGQKAVGSTAAAQERDREYQEPEAEEQRECSRVTIKEVAVPTGREGHSERTVSSAVTDQEGLLAKTGRADLSVKTVSSAATDQEGHSEKTGRADLSERTVSPVQTDREDHSAKAESVREEVSERIVKEDRWEATERVQVREIQQERALQGRISTISAMKTKAESTR